MSSSSTRLPTPEGPGSVCTAEQGISRRRFAGLAGAALAAGLAPAGTHAYAAGERGFKPRRRWRRPRPPHLPAGFNRTFSSRFVNAGGLRQHAVIGGAGPPLLLVHGWPENWYAWRKVMPALARDFEVIAVISAVPGAPTSPPAGTTPAPSPATWSR